MRRADADDYDSDDFWLMLQFWLLNVVQFLINASFQVVVLFIYFEITFSIWQPNDIRYKMGLFILDRHYTNWKSNKTTDAICLEATN